jgi:hypothetical protein
MIEPIPGGTDWEALKRQNSKGAVQRAARRSQCKTDISDLRRESQSTVSRQWSGNDQQVLRNKTQSIPEPLPLPDMKDAMAEMVPVEVRGKKPLFSALRFLYPIKPKPGLMGTPALRACLRAERICLFQQLSGTSKLVP